VRREGRLEAASIFNSRRVDLAAFTISIQIIMLLLCKLAECGNFFGCLQILTPEEQLHPLHIGVSLSVPGRRVTRQ
jgi:hypothetical protein